LRSDVFLNGKGLLYFLEIEEFVEWSLLEMAVISTKNRPMRRNGSFTAVPYSA
jgi:hypothetical protein